MRIRICNINGGVVLEANELMNNSIIDISNQAKGVYFVKITLGESVFVEKAIYQ